MKGSMQSSSSAIPALPGFAVIHTSPSVMTLGSASSLPGVRGVSDRHCGTGK
jgi:hypothetical protein